MSVEEDDPMKDGCGDLRNEWGSAAPSALTWGCRCHKRCSAEGQREAFPCDSRLLRSVAREGSEGRMAGGRDRDHGPRVTGRGSGTFLQETEGDVRERLRDGRRTALGGGASAFPGAPGRRGERDTCARL